MSEINVTPPFRVNVSEVLDWTEIMLEFNQDTIKLLAAAAKDGTAVLKFFYKKDDEYTVIGAMEITEQQPEG